MFTFLIRRLTEGSSYVGLGAVVAGIIDAYISGGTAMALPLILGGAAGFMIPDKGANDGR